jgi:hypothetical protein
LTGDNTSDLRIELHQQEPSDPWRGLQPRYESIVMRGPGRFELLTKLPTGEPISVRLGRPQPRA